MNDQRGRRRSLRAGELALALFGLAVLAFGVGAGIELAGLGWQVALVAVVLIVLGFMLALLRGLLPGRAVPLPPPPHPAPREQAGPALHADRAVLEDSALIPGPTLAGERPRSSYFLGVAGGAALSLSLGGVLFLALPSDITALVVLIVGVVAWAIVVTLSLRLQLRR